MAPQPSKALQVDPPTCWHACDSDHLPRRALLAAHNQPSCPTADHDLFGDLRKRVSETTLLNLQRIRERVRSEYEASRAPEDKHLESNMRPFGDIILEASFRALEDEALIDSEYCFRHGKRCLSLRHLGPAAMALATVIVARRPWLSTLQEALVLTFRIDPPRGQGRQACM